MKICLIPKLSQLSSNIGGVNRVIHDLAKYLTLAGHVIVENPDDADIVHCHAVGEHPRPDVYTNHGYWDAPNTPWEIHANERMAKMIVDAHIVTSPSEWSTKVYKDKFKVVPRVIRNGVNLSELEKVPSGNAYKWLGIDKPYLLYGKNKVQDTEQAKAIRDLAQQLPEIPIVATAWDNNVTKPSNVLVVGLLPYDKMMQAIRDSIALISVTKECFSVQVVESLAMGKPVIGWQHGGTAEVIHNGKNGYLVRPGESLLPAAKYLLDNYEQLSTGAKLSAQEYDLESKIIPQYAQCYEECIENTHSIAVSIVITCYNLGHIIGEAIESCLYQKFNLPYEIIVIDDCSTDNSRTVLTELKRKYPQLKIIFNASNMNAAPSRNRAIAMAKGEFIVSLDGDDKINKQFLAKLYPVIAKDKSIGIAYSDFERFGDYPYMIARTKDWDYDALLRHNYIPCCCLFRKDAWYKAGGYRNLGGWEDYDLWIAIGEAGYKGVRVPECLFYYRQMKNNRAWRSALNARNLRRMLKEKHPQYIGPSPDEIRRFEIAAGIADDKTPPATVINKEALVQTEPINIESIDEELSAANFWGRNTEEPTQYKLLEYTGAHIATEVLIGKMTHKKYFYSASHPVFEAHVDDVPGLMAMGWFKYSN